MAIFQHFSFGPPLETMKKELSKEASQNKKEAYAENLSCLSHWEPRNLPRPPTCGRDDQTLLIYKKIFQKKIQFFQKTSCNGKLR